jgi:uncharacterized membrane protein YhaH (DUF805 family)
LAKDARAPTLLWAMLGFDGRIGREAFWLGNIGSNLVAFLILRPDYDANGFLHFGNAATLPLVFAALAWIVAALSVKRLHDMNLTGWLAGLMFVPFIGIVPFFAVGAMRGTRGPNPYGPGTNLRGTP